MPINAKDGIKRRTVPSPNTSSLLSTRPSASFVPPSPVTTSSTLTACHFSPFPPSFPSICLPFHHYSVLFRRFFFARYQHLLPLSLPLSLFPLLLLLLLMMALPSNSLLHRRHEYPPKCSIEGEVCTTINAHVCRNGTCVSACSLRGMKECRCDIAEDNFCFLCCGSANDQCLPAYEYGILRDNGERWERESCSWCRRQGTEREGMPCDDTDPQRLCLHGKCSKSVCANKVQGQYCDRKEEKICVDDICENPCARVASHLMVCDCPAIDPDTGFASEDRCQLCCHDYTQKPASRRCHNAFRKYQVKSAQERPIWRIGLECAGGKRCNRYGICSNDAQLGGNGKRTPILIAIAFFVFAMIAVIGTMAGPF